MSLEIWNVGLKKEVFVKKFRVKCVIFNGKFFVKKLIDKYLLVLSNNPICPFLCKVKSCICFTIS